jgi:hypothetical protein
MFRDASMKRSEQLGSLERQGIEDARLGFFRPPSDPRSAQRERVGDIPRDTYCNSYWREWGRLEFEQGRYTLI